MPRALIMMMMMIGQRFRIKMVVRIVGWFRWGNRNKGGWGPNVTGMGNDRPKSTA